MSTRHAPSSRFGKFAKVEKGRQLAVTTIEAAKLHREGTMNDDQYRQRRNGLEQEAKDAGVEEQYRSSLAMQMANSAAGEAIRLLEKMRRDVEERFYEALAHEARVGMKLRDAQEEVKQAETKRAECEALVAQVNSAIEGLVRS